MHSPVFMSLTMISVKRSTCPDAFSTKSGVMAGVSISSLVGGGALAVGLAVRFEVGFKVGVTVGRICRSVHRERERESKREKGKAAAFTERARA